MVRLLTVLQDGLEINPSFISERTGSRVFRNSFPAEEPDAIAIFDASKFKGESDPVWKWQEAALKFGEFQSGELSWDQAYGASVDVDNAIVEFYDLTEQVQPDSETAGGKGD